MYLTDQSQSPWVGVPLVAYSMSWANPWKSRDVSFEETNSPSRTFLHRVGYIAGYLRVGIKVVDGCSPYKRGGKIGLFGGVGRWHDGGIMVLLKNIAKNHTGIFMVAARGCDGFMDE